LDSEVGAFHWVLDSNRRSFRANIREQRGTETRDYDPVYACSDSNLCGPILRRLMRNCRLQGRSRNLMLVPNLRPKVVPHSGSRLLLGLIVRARRRLVAGAPPARCAQEEEARSPGAALGERGAHPSDSLPVASLPQRERLLALRVGAPAPLLPEVVLPEPTQSAHPSPGARVAPPAAGLRPGALGAIGRLPHPGHYPHPGDREGEGFSQGTFRGAGELRAQCFQDRVDLWFQGGAGGGL